MRTIVIAFLIVFFCACNQGKKFDRSAWSEEGDLGVYPNRNKMLKDLMNNHQLKGLRYKRLVELLGEPANYLDAEPNVVYYNIVTDYGWDIDPVYIKNMKVTLNSDSIVTEAIINEIKH